MSRRIRPFRAFFLLLAVAVPAQRLAGQQPADSGAVVAASAAAAPAAPARPAPVSWTSGRAPLHVGDPLIVRIDELTLAEADRDASAARQRDRDLSLKGGSGSTSVGGSLRTGNDVSRSERGSSSRRDRLATELSVRVAEIGPGGTLRIEGTRKVVVDEHAQDVSVSGWIRAQDVGPDNTVASWRIADAQIRYTSNGALLKAGGIWSKLLDLVVP